jgi:hypothetical protein
MEMLPLVVVEEAAEERTEVVMLELLVMAVEWEEPVEHLEQVRTPVMVEMAGVSL